MSQVDEQRRIDAEARFQRMVGESPSRTTPDRREAGLKTAKRIADSHSSRKRVVFFAETPYFSILRESRALRARGYETALFCLKPLTASLEPVFLDSFDYIEQDLGSFTLLGDIAATIRADVFHIQCWMWGYHIARHIIERSTHVPCICDFYDITSAYMPRGKLYELMSDRPGSVELVDMDLEMEQFLFRNSNGVVHRFSEHLVEKLQGTYDSTVPALSFLPWPSTEFCVFKNVRHSDEHNVPHIVYAGALHPDRTDPALSSIANLSETVRNLVSQNVVVHIYLDPFRSIFDARSEYESWFALNEEFENLEIHEGVPPHQLPEILSQYDYGLLALDIHPDAVENLSIVLECAIGTKVFSYLESGLPVLVDSKAVYVSDFLKKYQVGLSLSPSDTNNFRSCLSNVDTDGLRENVKTFCHNNTMAEKITELENLYEEAARDFRSRQGHEEFSASNIAK